MLKLVDFIVSHEDWRERLSNKPYCLKIREDEKFIMFNYSQIDSDFNNIIVRECRGLILDKRFDTVCVPFYKFGNYGESYVPSIDWTTARVQQKVDGSIIKLWFHGKWNVSTNGTINADNAPLSQDTGDFKTFGDLFRYAAVMDKLDYRKLDPDCTYMFELTSPYNRVVVRYEDISLTHIGTRNNKTLQELDVNIGIKKPKSYGLSTLDECLEVVSTFGNDEEGFVIVDKDWNRIKVKSPAYVALHHLKGNGVVNKHRIVSLIRLGEVDEFIGYFPEYTADFENVVVKVSDFIEKQNKILNNAAKCKFNSRKAFADYAKSYKHPALLFNWYDGKVKDAEEWLWGHDDKRIVELIGG